MKIPTSIRLQEILRLLEDTGYVKAKALAEKYDVSMETIRKDLTYLEEIGIVQKEYGGASLSALGVEKNLDFRSHHLDDKKAIARYAVTLLKEHHSILLDSGSTCQACVPYINHLTSKDIITNSLRAYEQLNGNIHNVFLTGGKKREKNQSMIGNWTVSFLKRIHVDICFLGTSGILDSEGPTAHSYQELDTKQAMIKQSDFVFVLADTSKFQEHGFHLVTGWENIDGIITNQHVSPNVYEKLSKKVPIYVAEESTNEEDC